MVDVTIPADVAKLAAQVLRGEVHRAEFPYEWADLLDPKSPSLREQVAKAWCADYYGEYSGSARNQSPEQLAAADAVLAVVADAAIEQLIALVGPRFADWLAAQPLTNQPASGFRHAEQNQRNHDERLLRGGSDA